MMEYRPSLPRKVVGFLLLFIGVLGVVLPILQGGIFLALGMFVLRHQYMWAHRGMGWIQTRWPNAVRKVEGMEERLIGRMQGWAARGRRLLGRG